jgi:hypothetical protein
MINSYKIYNTNELIINAKIVVAITHTTPGSIKLWFNKYFPIFVVPVRSNETAANTVP